jgi:hypothetical protein
VLRRQARDLAARGVGEHQVAGHELDQAVQIDARLRSHDRLALQETNVPARIGGLRGALDERRDLGRIVDADRDRTTPRQAGGARPLGKRQLRRRQRAPARIDVVIDRKSA